MALKLVFDFGNDENYDFLFKIVNFIIGLGSLMICTHDLTILRKTKENDLLLWTVRVRWQKLLSTHVSIVLTKVSVLVEDG
jgi:hypothetical protein